MVFVKCQNYTVSRENSILLEELFMILHGLLEDKSIEEDLNFVQLVQMPEDDRNLVRLY
jgi:hypothetical protein